MSTIKKYLWQDWNKIRSEDRILIKSLPLLLFFTYCIVNRLFSIIFIFFIIMIAYEFIKINFYKIISNNIIEQNLNKLAIFCISISFIFIIICFSEHLNNALCQFIFVFLLLYNIQLLLSKRYLKSNNRYEIYKHKIIISSFIIMIIGIILIILFIFYQ